MTAFSLKLTSLKDPCQLRSYLLTSSMTNDYFFPLIAIDELSNAAAVVVFVIPNWKSEGKLEKLTTDPRQTRIFNITSLRASSCLFGNFFLPLVNSLTNFELLNRANRKIVRP